MKQFRVLTDIPGRGQEDRWFARESDAWLTFWMEVARQPDDGVALTGYDEKRVLASRTGTDGEHVRWYVHLMREAA